MPTVLKDILGVDGDAYQLSAERQFLENTLSLILNMEATGFYDEFTIQISGDKA